MRMIITFYDFFGNIGSSLISVSTFKENSSLKLAMNYSHFVKYTFVNKDETITVSPYLILLEFRSSW